MHSAIILFTNVSVCVCVCVWARVKTRLSHDYVQMANKQNVIFSGEHPMVATKARAQFGTEL